MKDIFIIDIHSYSDVITNSSTDLFVVGKETTLDEVKRLLEEKWNAFIKLYPNRYECDDDIVLNKNSVWDVLDVRCGLTDYEKKSHNEEPEYDWGYEANATDDTIIICGNDDNAIPYEFQEVIEHFFNAQRYHLG